VHVRPQKEFSSVRPSVDVPSGTVSVLSEASEESVSPSRVSLLTTGQASKLCAVAPRTIARWADSGLLRSHRTVGGRRRMLRSDLLEFMRAHGMPIVSNDPSHRLRIAVVDDERSVVRALLRMLARAAPGADCRSAHDGFSAGALLTSFHPDLVFLDIIMPGLSGVDVCEHIRSKPELYGTRVVIVTGHLTAALRAQLETVGADGFIEKPFSFGEIQSTVADLTARRPGSEAPRPLHGASTA